MLQSQNYQCKNLNAKKFSMAVIFFHCVLLISCNFMDFLLYASCSCMCVIYYCLFLVV